MKDKKVFIIGNLYPLVKSLYESGLDVYVATSETSVKGFAKVVDIREDNSEELLKFALDNQIDLTIIVSSKAIANDVAGIFQQNGQTVFAPSALSAEFTTSRAQAKRFMYKTHIPTLKFGIFEKLPLAIDYLENANYPLVVSSDMTGDNNVCLCTTFECAKNFAEILFMQGESKIVIEEYSSGHNFTMYFITDGYNILPLGTEEVLYDLTTLDLPIAVFTPDNKVTLELQNKILKEIAQNITDTLQKNGEPYVGILGIDFVLTQEDELYVTGARNSFRSIDAAAILDTLEDDFYDLAQSCANGFFADEYEDILLNDNVSASIFVKSKINILDKKDLMESKISRFDNDRFVMTSLARTMSRAKKNLLEDLEALDLKFRIDILNS